MSFIRTDKAPGSPPDALDGAFGIAREAITAATFGARPGMAGSLIRHVSAVASAGGSVEARAAAVFVRRLRDHVSEPDLTRIAVAAGARTAELIRLVHDDPAGGPDLADRVTSRLGRIEVAGDGEARLLLEVVAEREAALVARSLRPGIRRDAELERAFARLAADPRASPVRATAIREDLRRMAAHGLS